MDLSPRDLVAVGLCTQAVADLALASIAWRCVRGKERSFLRLWSASWLCLAVYHGAGVAAMLIAPPSSPLIAAVHTGLSALAQVMSLWQIGLLLLGVYVARGGEAPRQRTMRIALVGGALLGAAVTGLTHGLSEETTLFWRMGLRGAIGGPALMVSAVLLARSTWTGGGLGPRMVTSAFFLYGASLLHMFAHELMVLLEVRTGTYFAWTTFTDLLLQMLAGFGILLWIVEEEINAKHSMARQLQERDNQLNESQKMEALGQLAGGIAHDFNNLLTTVLGNVDWLRSSARLKPAHRAALEDVEQSVRRGSAITKQLQALSRGNQGELVTEDLNAKIHDVLPVISPWVGANIELKADTCSSSCPVRVVKGQTEQILLNLVINARDAIANNGRIRLSTRCVPDEHGKPRVLLQVSDNGKGMDEATVARVFEPFFSTKQGGLGTGLGMTSVWNIVENSDGTIRVDSKKGVGTTITVDWPRSPAEVTLPTRPTDVPQRREPLQILIAEDDDPVRQSTARTLIEAGHKIVAVQDGVEALEVLEAAEFDLVLSDVLMPNMDGIELAHRVLEQHPELPFALMSGYMGSDQERPGDIPLLRKPFTGRQLLGFVNRTYAEFGGRPQAAQPVTTR